LLGVNRASLYYASLGEREENQRLMRLIDEQYTRTPFFGSRRMTAWLREAKQLAVNRKRVSRLRGVMELEAMYASPN
jgi:putative transposase